jgi:L-asparagine transporter-like permease
MLLQKISGMFKITLQIMPYAVLGFFAVVLYSLALNKDTRITLYVLPLWFLGLGCPAVPIVFALI